jgi:AcrR family transcriptional regulator
MKMKTAQAFPDDPGQPPAKSKGRRPGRPSLSNEQLLDKALDLFLEQGFERTSIDAITVAAGMAKRTVYLRYGDKETLFKAALERAIEEWIVPVERLRAAEGDSLADSLLAIARILVANIISPAGLRLMRLTNAESGRMPEIGAFTVRAGTAPTVGYLADLFRGHLGAEGSDFPDPEQAAAAFLYLVVGTPASQWAWGVTMDEAAIDRHTRHSVRLFLHGFLPRQGTPDDGAETLEDENRRLRDMLVAAMLDISSLKEQVGKRQAK